MKQVTIAIMTLLISGAAFASKSSQSSSSQNSSNRVAWEPQQNKTECGRLHAGSLLDNTAAVSKGRTAKAGQSTTGRD